MEVRDTGVNIRGIKHGIILEGGNGEGRQGKSRYVGNLHPIGVIATDSSHIMPNNVILWIEAQHVLVIILYQQDAEVTKAVLEILKMDNKSTSGS